jgi:hypothetical protein
MMDAKLTRRSPVMIVVSLALLLALAAGYLFWPRSKPEADAQKKPAVGAVAESKAAGGSVAASAARSPKELALAGFLSPLKLEGKPVLIEFGMVGCVLSGQGLDSMIALQAAGAVPGLAFVRVEGNPDAAVVAQYFKDKAPSFPVYRDSQSALAKALSATAYPTFLLADKFGHIRYEGSYPQENLVQWGKALVAEKQDPGSSVAQFGAREIDVEKLLADKLPDLKDQIRPLSEYKGSGGLVLLFVDTSCPFSAAALREMPMVSKSLAGQNVNAVVLNTGDSQSDVRDFYARNDPGVPVVYDDGAATREHWNVHSVPIVVYISPAGKVGYQGEATWANMGSAIETSLGLAPGAIKFTAAGTGFG